VAIKTAAAPARLQAAVRVAADAPPKALPKSRNPPAADEWEQF
jgi:hypothetical protein